MSLPIPLDEWHPFDLLIERNSNQTAHPDLAFASRQQLVPVVGVCLVESWDGAQVAAANAAVERLVASREMSVISVDTRLDIPNATGLRTKGEIESVLARMDAVITTRLHGMVLSLKNGVPAVVIDPEPGGSRIWRQAQKIGWPAVFKVDALDENALRDALDYCLTSEAAATARNCAERADLEILEMRSTFLKGIENPQWPGPKYRQRRSDTRVRGP